jgi:hypothetical protein
LNLAPTPSLAVLTYIFHSLLYLGSIRNASNLEQFV